MAGKRYQVGPPAELEPTNPEPEIRKWITERAPQLLHLWEETVLRADARGGLGEALMQMVSIGFAAGRQYEHDRSMPTFPPEAPDELDAP